MIITTIGDILLVGLLPSADCCMEAGNDSFKSHDCFPMKAVVRLGKCSLERGIMPSHHVRLPGTGLT